MTGVFIQQSIGIATGKTYQITMEARGEGEGKLGFKVSQGQGHIGCMRHIPLTDEWMRHVAVFKCAEMPLEAPPNLRIQLAAFVGKIFIRSVSVQEIEPQKLRGKGGWSKSFALDEEIVIGDKKPPPKAEPKPPPKKPKKPKSNATLASDLAAAFAKDLAGSKSAYQNAEVRVRGRVTNIQPALAGDVLLELDGGRASILVSAGEISNGQNSFVKGQLAIAKRQAFESAYPVAELTAAVVGFRGGSVKMRKGKDVMFEKGE